MTDDIKAIRDALAAGPTPGPWQSNEDGVAQEANPHRYRVILSANVKDNQRATDSYYIAACHPERIARLLDALEAATKDAERWRHVLGKVYVDPEQFILRIADTFLCLNDGPTVADQFTAAIDAAMKGDA